MAHVNTVKNQDFQAISACKILGYERIILASKGLVRELRAIFSAWPISSRFCSQGKYLCAAPFTRIL